MRPRRELYRRRERTAGALGGRLLVLLTVLATMVAPTVPHAVPHAVASRAVTDQVPASPAVAPGSLNRPAATGAAPDHTADTCPTDEDSVERKRSAPPLLARTATVETVRVTHPAPATRDLVTAVDESPLAAIYRCNPDGRGPPPRA